MNCLENSQCKDLEEAVNLLSNLEFEQARQLPQMISNRAMFNLLVHQANHPVHILDADGKLSPSAFIPFCAWAGDMGSLGINTTTFSLPVCNAFQPRCFTSLSRIVGANILLTVPCSGPSTAISATR